METTVSPTAPDEIFYRNPGLFYIHFLSHFVRLTGASSYFEIGTKIGSSLAPISVRSLAVDPRFQLAPNVLSNKKICHFFQMKSDEFFSKFDPRHILGRALDVCFLDGMHQFEYLLRDFINTEKCSAPSSTAILHDCLPGKFGMTVRNASQRPQGIRSWTGDVWKVVQILGFYRPDLNIVRLNCNPTGLVVIRNLDARNDILQRNYDSIVDAYAPKPSDEVDLRLFCHSNPSESIASIEDIKKLVEALGFPTPPA